MTSNYNLLKLEASCSNATFDQMFAFREAYLIEQEKERVAWDKSYPERAEREFRMRDGTFDILDDLSPEDNLIMEWTRFGTLTQDAYPEYHTGSMITLISHLFPAKMTPQYSKKGIYNNMWLIILGNSGCGKSMACGAAVGVAYEESIAPYYSRLSNKFTPESLTHSLSEGSRRFHYSNEAVGFLKNMKRDYAGELPEDLTNSYDGERISKQTIKHGVISCEHPLYSAIWNTTIDSWSRNATEDGFASGMFMRPFYLISTRKRELMKDTPLDAKFLEMRTKFVANLLELLELVHGRVYEGVPQHPRVVVFAESEYINNWKHQLREEGNAGKYSELEQSALQRVFDQCRKLAMNLTIASTEFKEYMKTQPAVTGALQCVNNEIECEIPEYIAEYACHISELVFWKNSIKALQATYATGVYDKVLRAFEGTDKKLTKTELGSLTGLHGDRLKDVLADLGLQHQKFIVPGSCRPVEYYWSPKIKRTNNIN